MLMTGSALAPFIGGALVETFGYPAIGVAGVGIALLCIGLFVLAGNSKTGFDVRSHVSKAKVV
jgi:predicted MFS family arabinose efflux permease